MKRYPVGSILVNEDGVLATIIVSGKDICILRYYMVGRYERDFPWGAINTWEKNDYNKIILPFNKYINAITNGDNIPDRVDKD